MWKPHFRRFLDAEPGRLHFAAHSHHPWPDVTFEAHAQAWRDAARWADEKWDVVFGAVVPAVQRRVAAELRLPSPDSLAFAPNTHELVLRLMSCLPERPHILTTDSEFHSFERQARRLEEDGLVTVERVPSEPFATFTERFLAAAKAEPHLVFFSHVFFNSGFVVPELPALVAALPASALICIDGYHGFCAVPTDLSAIASRAFYLAGGYKYAMAGEGACFLHVPASAATLRPRNTGWFAAFGALEEKQAGRVPYAAHGARFFGATFDPSGLYRLDAVLRWREEQGLTTERVRAHAHALQRRFLAGLGTGPMSRVPLVVADETCRGHFLTFRTSEARSIAEALKRRRVITDARDDRLRFGFGLYQDEADVDAVLERLG
jgi:selenocysteine lyase/cysteine desulfurase